MLLNIKIVQIWYKLGLKLIQMGQYIFLIYGGLFLNLVGFKELIGQPE